MTRAHNKVGKLSTVDVQAFIGLMVADLDGNQTAGESVAAKRWTSPLARKS